MSIHLALGVVGVLSLGIVLAAAVYDHAENRDVNAPLWATVVLVLGPLGALFYVIVATTDDA